MKKLLILVAGAAGYVLGTKAGRERYDQIMQMFGKVKDDPRVAEAAHQVAEVAKKQAPVVAEKVSDAAGVAKDKAAEAAGAAKAKVGSDSSNGSDTSGAIDKAEAEERLEQVRSTGPQGDLP